MTFPRPTVDIHRPPEELDALVDWFELVSYNLVLLEEYPLDDIRKAITRAARAIEDHGRLAEHPPASVPLPPELQDLGRILAADHDWFRTSVDQLWWFFGVVEREDHGGHRQALGQYGRVLSEALRRHLAEEAEFDRRTADHRRTGTIARPPGNPN